MPRWITLLFALSVCAVAVHQWQFWRDARLDANVLALLPEAEQDPLLRAANARLAELGEHSVVVLVGAADFATAKRAAAAAREVLLRDVNVLVAVDEGGSTVAAMIEFLAPWRDRLLTRAQRDGLRHADIDALAQQALVSLYQPVGQPRIGSFASDPLSLWPAWWRERAQLSQAQPREGVLTVASTDQHWIVLRLDAVRGAFSVSGATPVSATIDAARTAVLAVDAKAELVAAGVPLHAEAAAARASFEVNTIGWGSLLAVLVLVWLTFRSLQPIALVALSLLIGCACALSVTALLFGQVHLLTLVFGASLVGVAEDYGFHYFAARQGEPGVGGHDIVRSLLPGLLLALATSVVAYLALGLAPFPGLRQMAVFSAVGLVAACLTVVCLFPYLDRRTPLQTRFATRVAASLVRWPQWRFNRFGMLVGGALLAFTVIGILKLQTQDDLRQLHAAPANLVAMQQRIDALLGLPSPAQFFLVEGDSEEQVLQREEALLAKLQALVNQGVLGGFQAISSWLPSAARQSENVALSREVELAVITRVNATTGDAVTRAIFSESPLTLDALLTHKAFAPLTRTWLGAMDGRQASVVFLSGVRGDAMPVLGASAVGVAGVRFINRTADISNLLARYRVDMGYWLVAGYFGVLLLLMPRYGRSAWRALLPTLIGSAVTLAIFGFMGWPLQLFGVLALLLLLGMGVDYGIFLLEHPGDGAAWLAVALAGISTLLAFGLLALSATPALRTFGLTMLFGELSIWLITPCFRPTSALRPGTA